MNRWTLVIGIICLIAGFGIGRIGMTNKTDKEALEASVSEGSRLFRLHYYASREQTADLFDYIAKSEPSFYKSMPASMQAGEVKPQCAVDLFGNLEKRRLKHEEQTKNWDSQVNEIEVRILSNTIHDVNW